MNTGNSVLVHYIKVYSLLQFVSSHREKEREYERWADRVIWAKRNNLPVMRKKRADTDLKFSSWFSVVVLTCLSAGPHLVQGSFSEPNSKIGLANFRHLTSSWLVFNWLPLLPHLFSKRVVSFLSHGVSGRNIRFRWFYSCAEDFGTSSFF